MNVLHRREDGTFIIEYAGGPYHVTADDPLFARAVIAAAGLDLPPEPPPPVLIPPVPAITPLQARRHLRAAGLHAAMQAWLAGQPDEVVEAWDYATHLPPSGSVLADALAAMGQGEAEIEAFFRAAAALA